MVKPRSDLILYRVQASLTADHHTLVFVNKGDVEAMGEREAVGDQAFFEMEYGEDTKRVMQKLIRLIGSRELVRRKFINTIVFKPEEMK